MYGDIFDKSDSCNSPLMKGRAKRGWNGYRLMVSEKVGSTKINRWMEINEENARIHGRFRHPL